MKYAMKKTIRIAAWVSGIFLAGVVVVALWFLFTVMIPGEVAWYRQGGHAYPAAGQP